MSYSHLQDSEECKAEYDIYDFSQNVMGKTSLTDNHILLLITTSTILMLTEKPHVVLLCDLALDR